MHLTTKNGLKIQLPTAEEDAAINAGIAADPDTYELSNAEFKQLRPVGRPKASTTKQRISIRLSPEVLSSFKTTGRGWQTRINDALKDWLRTHEPAA